MAFNLIKVCCSVIFVLKGVCCFTWLLSFLLQDNFGLVFHRQKLCVNQKKTKTEQSSPSKILTVHMQKFRNFWAKWETQTQGDLLQDLRPWFLSEKKTVKTLFTGLGWFVLGKSVPSVLNTKLWIQFFPIWSSWPVNNVIYYVRWTALYYMPWTVFSYVDSLDCE